MCRLIARGVRGVTANPTIVAKAIESSDAYDQQFHRLIDRRTQRRGRLLGPGRSPTSSTRSGLLRPTFDLSDGRRRVRLDRGGARAGARH